MENLRDEKDITVIKEYVSWLNVNTFINSLKEFIEENDFNGVYGPARGGLIFAVMISHKYNLPFLGAPQKGCLVIDDIVDTGKTAEAWKDKGYKIASMYYKKNPLVEPDFWAYEKTDQWIVFPWEEIQSNEKIGQAQDIITDTILQAYPVWSSTSFSDKYKEAMNAYEIIQGGNYNE